MPAGPPVFFSPIAFSLFIAETSVSSASSVVYFFPRSASAAAATSQSSKWRRSAPRIW
jgi:hypothetical protein